MLFTLRSLSESRFGKNNLATAVDNRLLRVDTVMCKAIRHRTGRDTVFLGRIIYGDITCRNDLSLFFLNDSLYLRNGVQRVTAVFDARNPMALYESVQIGRIPAITAA